MLALSFVYGIHIFIHVQLTFSSAPLGAQVRWTTWQVATWMMRMLGSQYPICSHLVMIRMAFDLDYFGRKSFSCLFPLLVFCMDQSQNIRWKQRRIQHASPRWRTGRLSGPLVASGDPAPRSHHKSVARTPRANDQTCQWTQDVFILDISQNPPNFLHTVRRMVRGGMDAFSKWFVW